MLHIFVIYSSESLKEIGENEKAVLSWKGPTKETLSSRLRREMNAGKGVIMHFVY